MKILYWVSEDWYFVSHRLRLAIKAKEAGNEVYVVTNISSHLELLKEHGLIPIPLGLDRSGANIFSDVAVMFRLWRIYRRVRPDVVHHVAMKPVLYGALVARISGIKKVINALAGLGYLFSSDDLKAKLLRPFVKTLFMVLLKGKNSHLIVQNVDDLSLFKQTFSLPASRVHLIRGAGVSLSDFDVVPEPTGNIRVVLLARLLRDKGVYEFVQAAQLLMKFGSNIEMVLVGDLDLANPSSVTREDLDGWLSQGIVEWQGFREDVAAVWRDSHISVLPSYREGLPKSLLESAASGRPMIASNVPGCREVVDDNTGILVPVRNPEALAKAILLLAENPSVRKRMGNAARSKVEQEFSADIVDEQVLSLYGVVSR